MYQKVEVIKTCASSGVCSLAGIDVRIRKFIQANKEAGIYEIREIMKRERFNPTGYQRAVRGEEEGASFRVPCRQGKTNSGCLGICFTEMGYEAQRLIREEQFTRRGE